MPYKPSDVTRFTKKATTPRRKRMWVHVYESAIRRGVPEGRAIAMASGVVKKDFNKSRKRSKRKKRG